MQDVLEDDCQLTAEQNQFAEIFQMIYDESDFENIELDDDAEEVATVICCYIAKKLLARFKGKACTLIRIGNATTSQYFHSFSRGNLTIPSTPLANFGCLAFALLHYYDNFVKPQDYLNVSKACTYILHHCSLHQIFSCEKHNADALKFAIKMVVNIYCNNKQNIKNDSVVKDTITGFKEPRRSKQTKSFECSSDAT